MSVRGVEANEASRFVDHTLATPWETLLSDLEAALRSLLTAGDCVTRINIYYYGLTYRFEKRRADAGGARRSHSHSHSHSHNHSHIHSQSQRPSQNQSQNESQGRMHTEHKEDRDFSWLHVAYNITWFILFSHNTQSSDYSQTYRATGNLCHIVLLSYVLLFYVLLNPMKPY
jgi:hypothetical protein